jgi:hypothetical protein
MNEATMDTARAIATSLAPFLVLYLVAMLGERAGWRGRLASLTRAAAPS